MSEGLVRDTSHPGRTHYCDTLGNSIAGHHADGTAIATPTHSDRPSVRPVCDSHGYFPKWLRVWNGTDKKVRKKHI